MSDLRFLQLNSWLNQVFASQSHPVLISGDASFRRYFRVLHDETSYIVMDSPPEQIPVSPFIKLAKAYGDLGINVPQVIESNVEDGFLLLSDLGDVQLISRLNDTSVEAYYSRALKLLDRFAAFTENAELGLPLYDSVFVHRELDIFTDWLIKHHLNLVIDADTRKMLEQAFALLVANAEEQPKVGMHRDYHSRNLMLTADEFGVEQLSVIDFQDAVIGPVTYDAVSLLRDCYIRWPDTLVEGLMEKHYLNQKQAGLIDSSVTLEKYRRWFDLMGIQRHIKAAGIFSRLNYRDGKPAYMADIPMTLAYIADISAGYPELEDFSAWVTNTLVPAFEDKL
ncbi:aminoglycoside phosphotransferase family protein [Shewanella violacea]|uniref:Phosphotransferase enzyme family protein n=1 Tax=Shewanella violacea (strain JCM 10179 / CIP 106290 / LMG 19151 / DSS12) TaxID=637905 RepID=D4ZGH3_SHEVD|nr:phosphotransferase enzyme family protein [Shewanella violacea DSS12]